MSLIKCTECNNDVSDKAQSCPHCGNPINIILDLTKKIDPLVQAIVKPKKIKKPFSYKKFLKIISIIGLIALNMLIATALVFLFSPETIDSAIKTTSGTIDSFTEKTSDAVESLTEKTSDAVDSFRGKTVQDPLAVQINSDGSKTYPVQYNNLFNYEFYTGKIDQSGNVDIGSEPKQTIAKLLGSLAYPRKLTKSLAIINVDPTLLGRKDKIQVPWTETKSIIITLQPEGGNYMAIDGGAIIFLNNLMGYDKDVLTHELGHHIGQQLTSQEWDQFYELRGIPAKTPIHTSNWNLSPDEDFAEVYKVAYKNFIVGSSGSWLLEAWSIKTYFGLLVEAPPFTDILPDSPCNDVYEKAVTDYMATQPKNLRFNLPSDAVIDINPKVQECRKNNNGQTKYGWLRYKSQIDAETEQFIKNVVARLNS